MMHRRFEVTLAFVECNETSTVRVFAGCVAEARAIATEGHGDGCTTLDCVEIEPAWKAVRA